MTGRLWSPRVAVAAILVAAAVGASVVYVSGRRIRAEDRAAYASWEQAVMPAVERLRARRDGLALFSNAAELVRADDERELAMLRDALAEVHADLEATARTIRQGTEAEITFRTSELYLDAIAAWTTGVEALQASVASLRAPRASPIAAFEDALLRGERRFAEGDAARALLRQRLRLDSS